MTEEETKYMQAVNRQKWDKAPNRVVLIERLPDRYRYTMADRSTLDLDLGWGTKQHPIALCGQPSKDRDTSA
jgi:hypothetical protein